MSGEVERVSRPSSLVLDAPPPEREPLHFDVQLIGAPPEVEQLVNNIKQVAEEFLYHWKTFPIVLPPSRFSGPGNRLSDIITPPPCDEIDAAALDAGSEPVPLSPKQLHSIREKGEFEVPSRHFPGETHVWRVAGWLQRGRARAKEQLYENAAQALALLVVTARDRLLEDCPVSVLAGLAALQDGLHRTLDLLVGLPSMEARDLEKRIREERSRYLVAELICKSDQAADVTSVGAWVSRAMRRSLSARDRDAPPLPVLYTTPHRDLVDLRLYRRETLRRAAPILQSILEREARGWFLHFRERHAAHLRNQKMPVKDIEEEVRAAAMKEYVTRVCNAVLSSTQLAALGAGVPTLLADQLRAAAILDRAEEKVRQKLEASLTSVEARLRASNPILSRSQSWRTRKLDHSATRLKAELRWAASEDAINCLTACSLHQHKYFLFRDVTFRRSREPLLAAELRAATVPTRVFTWRARVCHVTCRHGAGTLPRSESTLDLRTDDVTVSDTRWPGWRLINIGHRIRSWSWNALYILCVAIVWNSPVSIRALLQRDPLVTDMQISQMEGTPVPKQHSAVPTLWSRLRALWRYVSKQRTRIDAEPDTGLVGSGALRCLRRAALVGCVGGLGSLAIAIVQPIVAVASCSVAVAAAATLPLWLPPLAILMHVSNAVVYDVDCPTEALNRWFPLVEALVWRVGVLGVLQPMAALILALLLCPLAALLLLLGGIVWWCVRGVWEAVSFRVLTRVARVPGHDCAFCRRVAGPGFDAPPMIKLTAGQAAAMAVARAESDALTEWANRTERALEKPLRDYEHFVDACFGPFSVQIAKTGAYRALEREIGALTGSLRAAVAARRRELTPPLNSTLRSRCRLTSADLRRARDCTAAELSRVWAIAPRDKEWWSSRGMEPESWHALAGDALVEVFHADVVEPLETLAAPCHTGPGSRAWEQRCARAAPPDIVGGAEPARAGAVPRVHAPSLDLGAFNPRAHSQPPVPSLATTAALLYNRDSENPIPLESELCAEILRALDDAPDADDKRDSVERYRGGGSSDSSSSDVDNEGDGDIDVDVIDEEERRPVPDDPPSPQRVPNACRWTLTGRGVRLRADLASPEDVTLDAERRGTSV